MKLTADAFRTTHPMPHPISAPRIFPVDEGSPIKKTYDLLIDPLIPPPIENFIIPVRQQIISSTITPNSPMKDKDNGIFFGRINSMKMLRKERRVVTG